MPVMKYIRGYRGIALIHAFLGICFFFIQGGQGHGAVYGSVGFFGAGVLLPYIIGHLHLFEREVKKLP